MGKCSRTGCDEEGPHVQVPVMGGAFFADAYFCLEHYQEGVDSLKDA